MMKHTYYKALGNNANCVFGGKGKWHTNGKWMPFIEDLIPCKSGYHLCKGEKQLLNYLGPEIWEVECRGEVINKGDKVIVQQARLVRQFKHWPHVAPLFAADCAERVLHLFENVYPHDDRPRKAIEACRQLRGTVDMYAATVDAANQAEEYKSSIETIDAAWAVVCLVRGAYADAAYLAARAANCYMEQTWQAQRLRMYLWENEN